MPTEKAHLRTGVTVACLLACLHGSKENLVKKKKPTKKKLYLFKSEDIIGEARMCQMVTFSMIKCDDH